MYSICNRCTTLMKMNDETMKFSVYQIKISAHKNVMAKMKKCQSISYTHPELSAYICLVGSMFQPEIASRMELVSTVWIMV